MFSKTLLACALLLFQALRGISSPILASFDDELVRIPFGGQVPKSKVHQVPKGGRVLHTPTEVKLLDANGSIIHAAPLTSSKPLFNPINNPNISSTLAPRTIQGVAEAIVQVPDLFAFEATWSIPPLPQKDSGQLLMYFSAIGPPSGDALLLAVLQYGVSAAGGGPFWGIASWLITTEETFITNLTMLPSPDFSTLQAALINEDEFQGTATTHAWLGEFAQHLETALVIETSEEYTVALNGLESTGVIQNDNLPNEPTPINEIFIEINGGSTSLVPIPWTFVNDTVDEITISDTTLAVVPDDGMMVIRYPDF